MSDLHSAEGSCLCGSVKLKTTTMNKNMGACHCGMCRKWGGPLLTVDCGQGVKVEGDTVGIFDSSEWAERGFCQKCGSHLFYRLKESQQYMVSAGLFSQTKDFNFDHQVFIDEKPSYYSFSNQTKDMTGAEIFAMYGSGND